MNPPMTPASEHRTDPWHVDAARKLVAHLNAGGAPNFTVTSHSLEPLDTHVNVTYGGSEAYSDMRVTDELRAIAVNQNPHKGLVSFMALAKNAQRGFYQIRFMPRLANRLPPRKPGQNR